MISSTVYNVEMNKLALIFEKSISKELTQMIYDKLAAVLNNDNQLRRLFEKLSEEIHFPRLGRMVTVVCELGYSEGNGEATFVGTVLYECICGNSFHVCRADLEKDAKVDCPGKFYETWNRSYHLGFLKGFAHKKGEVVVLPANAEVA